MKKGIACLLAALCILSALLCAGCGKTLVYRDGEYDCSANHVTYVHVPDAWVAVGTPDTDKPYATITGLGNEKWPVYEVPGKAPEQWLVTQDGILLAAKGTVLPIFGADAVSEMALCFSAAQSSVFASETNAARLEEITGLVTEGHALGATPYAPSDSYRIRFLFPELSGVAYELTLLYFENGWRVYDALSPELAERVETALAEAEAALSEEELAAGVKPEPVIPLGYRYLDTDARVRVTLERLPVEKNGETVYEWNVVYDYGKYVIRDRSHAVHYATWGLFDGYLEPGV